jgi:hypothetical protein
MPHLPVLRVVPLEKVRRHEQVDPLRVDRLSQRIGAERIQVNPMVCVEAPGGELVLLDGATRTESLRRIGLTHAVVQIVDPATVRLRTWHHVITGCTPAELIAAIESRPDLELTDMLSVPAVHTYDGETYHVHGVGISANAALSALVESYVGQWHINRATEPDRAPVERDFGDWAAVVEFPHLTIEDVMSAALGEDLLPAGITRFLVPERALRLNVELSLLEANETTEQKQGALESVLKARASAGRIRRYDEPVFIFDE